MANTKAKSSKKSNPLTMMGLAPVFLVAITVSLVLITGSEIIACTRYATDASKPKTLDCVLQESEAADCASDERIDDLIEDTQMQTYHSIIVVLISLTLLSAGLDVAYLSLARK